MESPSTKKKQLEKYKYFVKSSEIQQIFKRLDEKKEKPWNDNPNVEYNRYEHLRNRLVEHSHVMEQNNELYKPLIKKQYNQTSSSFHPRRTLSRSDQLFSLEGFQNQQSQNFSKKPTFYSHNQEGSASPVNWNKQSSYQKQYTIATPQSKQFSITQSSFFEGKKVLKSQNKINTSRSYHQSYPLINCQNSRDYSMRQLYYQHIKYDKSIQEALKTCSASYFKSMENIKNRIKKIDQNKQYSEPLGSPEIYQYDQHNYEYQHFDEIGTNQLR